MRQIALDTETTGLDAQNGHRIIEIGCVEVVNRRLTHNNLHFYLNPEREIDEGATRVHGMTLDDLRDKPRFGEVVDQFLAFCDSAEIVIHNAGFDVAFLDAELARLGRRPFKSHCAGVVDTLAMAREMFPGKRNNLDALCERMMIPNKHRTLHGALLDAELLAEVYLSLTRGQGAIEIGAESAAEEAARHELDGAWPPEGLRVRCASPTEREAHRQMLEQMARQSGREPLWRAPVGQIAPK